jgi:AraC-like DNA-binding protein
MPPIEPSGLARIPLIVLDRAPEFGLNRQTLMHDAGLTEAELDDPDARVPIRKVWRLWRAAAERAGDPWLPVRVAGSTPLRSYGLVGYTMSNSATVRRALERLARYSRIMTEAIRVRFVPTDAGAKVVIDAGMVDNDDPRSGPDTRHAFLLSAVRELTREEVVPLEVRLPYPRPDDADELGRLLRAPLVFDPPNAAVTFSREQLELPVRGADETLGGYLEQFSSRLLRDLPNPESFQDQVRRAMWSMLGDGSPALRTVAAKLAVSPRTLQRRLREEGTSYGELLDALRQEFAIRLLRERKLAVYEIAFLLGYAEPSTFHRAFRRWTGSSPQQYRKGAR